QRHAGGIPLMQANHPFHPTQDLIDTGRELVGKATCKRIKRLRQQFLQPPDYNARMRRLLRVRGCRLRDMRFDSIERGKSEVRSTRQTIKSELQHRENRFEIKSAEQFNIQDWAALIGI